MSAERLTLVLVYALQFQNGCGEPAHPAYVSLCHGLALDVKRGRT